MKTKLIKAIAIAAVATSATLPARAAYYDWKGKSGKTSYFDDLSCWGGNPGSDISRDAHYFGYGKVEVLNSTITSWKSLSLSGLMVVKKGTYSFVAEAADAGINSSVNIEIGSATATAEFKSGTYKFNQTQIGKASGNTGTLKVSGGTFTSTDCFIVGNAGTGNLERDGGTVKATGNYSRIGAGGNGVVTIKSGSFDNLDASNKNLTLGQNASCSGTLNVEGGTFTIGGQIFLNYDANAVKSTINITGGTLTANKISLNSAGTSGGTITINGGTVRAYANNVDFIPAHDDLNIYVGENGGTIDTNNKVITIGEPLLEDATSTGGGMTFTGGGVVTLASGNTYTGKTTAEVGTTVHIPSAGEIGGGLAVSVPADAPADGVYTLLVCDGEGAFTDAVLSGVAAPEGSRLLVTAGGKSVVCIYGNDPGPVWIGGTSGSLSVASNWANGVVPGAGTNCVIGVAGAAMLTVGDAFAASSITFAADSAAVTISAAGEETLSGITAITNLSTTANHVFNVALSGADNAAVVMNTQTYCVFNGGMTAYDVDFSQLPASDDARTFAGNWTLTTTADWTPAKNATVASGASLTVNNYSNNASDTLLINAGGVVTAEVAKVTGSYASGTTHYLTRGIYGTMVVTDECKMDSGSVNAFVRDEASTGTIIARKFSSASTSIKYFLGKASPTLRYVVGAGGISGTGWTAYSDWNPVIGCAADFDITGEIKGYTSGTKNTYTLDTTGGYKVSLVSGGKLTGERMALNVTGDGTLALAGGTADFQKGLTVGADATLEVAQSGTNTLSSTLALADGATLGFSVTDKINPPVLDLSGKTVTCSGAVKVKLSGKRPVCGTAVYTLTQGGGFTGVTPTLVDKPNWVKNIGIDENVNIYVTMCRTGLMIIIE